MGAALVAMGGACTQGSAGSGSERTSLSQSEGGPRESVPVAPVADLDTLKLSLSCEMHGTGITKRRTTVEGRPPSVSVGSGEDQTTKRHDLERGALKDLVSLLESERFATFVAETPKEGSAAPGMEHCTLALRWKDQVVEAKSWRSTDTFTPDASQAKGALRAELAKLASP